MSHQRRRGIDARIWRTVVIQDNRGNQVRMADADGPHEVRVWVSAQRSARAEVPGQQKINIIRIGVAADLEGVELWSRVEILGSTWDVVTPPAYHHGTRRTRHWSMDLRERP